MYAQQNKNITMIDKLLDLEDIEPHSGNGGVPNMGVGQHVPFQNHVHAQHGEIPVNYRKFIRPGMGHPMPESGMGSYSQHQHQQEFFTPPPQYHEAQMRPPVGSPTCLEIADHVGSCPICSRFYKTDNTVYIIAIVILAIICILLLKRVLNL